MDKLLDRINQSFERIGDFSNRHRIAIWALFFITIVFSAVGATRFTIVSENDAYFGQDDPVKKAYDNFRVQFGGTDTIYVVYRAKDGDVLSEASLRALKKVQDELLYYRLTRKADEVSPLDRIIRVRSLINAPYIERREDALVSRPFIGTNFPKTDEERERVRALAWADPAYRSSLLSDNKAYGGLVITTDFGRLIEKAVPHKPAAGASAGAAVGFDGDHVDPGEPEFEAAHESDEKGLLMQEISALFAKAPELQFYPVGEPAVVEYMLDTMSTQIVLEVLSMLTIVVILLAAFRSLSAVVWPVVIISVALLVCAGLIGWTNATMTNIFVLLVIIIWVNGVGITTHMLAHYMQHRKAGMPHREALRLMLKVSGFDSAVMSLTTVIGLLSLIGTPIVPIRNIGIFDSIGFVVVLLLTLFVFPLMLNIWHPNVKVDENKPAALTWLDQAISVSFRRIADFVLAVPRSIVVVFVALSAVLVYGAMRLEVDSNIAHLFPEGSRIRQAFELSDRHMAGSNGLEILVDGHAEETLKDPAVLNAMEAVQVQLKQRYPDLIRKTYSTADIVKKTHQAFAGAEGNEGYVIPQRREALEQTFFMFSIADSRTRRDWVADDYSRGRIRVAMSNQGNKALLDVLEDAQQTVDKVFEPLKKDHPKLEVRLTGGAVLQARLDDYVSRSQVTSFGQTLAVVSVLLFVVTASIRVGAMAIVANVFPVLMTFGLMGLFGVPLTVDSAFSAPVIVGISVDDTIRFLLQYRRSQREHDDMRSSIRTAIREVGPGLTFASLILASGFVIIMAFPIVTVATMGLFTAIAIASALLANVVVLPAMLQLFGPRHQFKANKAPAVTAAPAQCALPAAPTTGSAQTTHAALPALVKD